MNYILEIPFFQAFSHALTEPSYLITFILLNLAGIAALILGLRKHKQTKQAGFGIIGVILFVLLFALSMIRPFSISGATSPEQAERGVYLGW